MSTHNLPPDGREREMEGRGREGVKGEGGRKGGREEGEREQEGERDIDITHIIIGSTVHVLHVYINMCKCE